MSFKTDEVSRVSELLACLWCPLVLRNSERLQHQTHQHLTQGQHLETSNGRYLRVGYNKRLGWPHGPGRSHFNNTDLLKNDAILPLTFTG